MANQTNNVFSSTGQSGVIRGHRVTYDLTFASTGSVTLQRDTLGDGSWVNIPDGTYTETDSDNAESFVACNWQLNCTDATGNITYVLASEG